jgi:predicted O-methyltransferase YrrM
MIKIINIENAQKTDILTRDIKLESGVEAIVADIIANVKENGDKALKEYALKFDKAEIENLRVTTEEIEKAYETEDKEFIRTLEIAKNNIKSLHYDDKVEILQGDARDVLETLAGRPELYDVVFIDAAKSHYKAFWDLCLPLCKEDALIICDNVLMKCMTATDEADPNRKYKTSIRKMREFIEYINNLEYAETCVLPIGDGVSLSVIDKELMKI